MGELLGLGEADAGERAQAGVHAVHRCSAAEYRAGRRAPLLDPAEQLRADPHRPAGGDLADQRGIEVLSRGQRPRGAGRLMSHHRL